MESKNWDAQCSILPCLQVFRSTAEGLAESIEHGEMLKISNGVRCYSIESGEMNLSRDETFYYNVNVQGAY